MLFLDHAIQQWVKQLRTMRKVIDNFDCIPIVFSANTSLTVLLSFMSLKIEQIDPFCCIDFILNVEVENLVSFFSLILVQLTTILG